MDLRYQKNRNAVFKKNRRAAPAAQRRLAGEPKAKAGASLPRSEINRRFFPASRFIRNWWYTCPPRSLNYRIWVKSLREKKAVLEIPRNTDFYIKSTRDLKRGLAFLRATQSSIARDCERGFKAASRGTVKGLTSFHWVFEEGEQWQACTNGFSA